MPLYQINNNIEYLWNGYWYYGTVLDYDEKKELYTIEYHECSFKNNNDYIKRIDNEVSEKNIRFLSCFWDGDEIEIFYYGSWYKAKIKDYLHNKTGPDVVYIDYPQFTEFDVNLYRIRFINSSITYK